MSTFTRVSTASNQNLAIEAFQSRQASLNKTQQQISSGDKYTDFGEMAKDGNTRVIVDFTSALSQIGSYQQTNQLLTSRLTATDKAISAMQDINTKAISAMTQERSAVQKDNSLGQQMQAMLQQIADQLNTNIDGRYLFSGADTGTAPVPSLSATNLDGAGNPTSNYYAGDATDLSQKVSADVSIQYNVRADNPAFQQLIGAMNLAIKAEANNDDAGLSHAIDMANSAQAQLANLRSNVDNNVTTIDQVNSQHSDFQTYYKNALDGLTQTDVAAASIQLSLDQAVLTASFQAFARVSSLSLGNYLK